MITNHTHRMAAPKTKSEMACTCYENKNKNVKTNEGMNAQSIYTLEAAATEEEEEAINATLVTSNLLAFCIVCLFINQILNSNVIAAIFGVSASHHPPCHFLHFKVSRLVRLLLINFSF